MKKIFGGLQPTPEDKRDFQFGSFFRLPELGELPTDFIVGKPLGIKDQGDTDFCAGFASAAVVEDHEGIFIIPEFIFAMAKEISGADPFSWGSDLRSICKALIKVGAVDFTNLSEDMVAMLKNPDLARDPASWPPLIREKAKQHIQLSYFAVSGQYDTFDNFRATMWANRDEKRSILTGVVWNDEWTMAPDGVINKKGTQAFGHALKIFGWNMIDGEVYLTAQLSNGDQIGDKGIFYFSRDVVNECFTFGGYTFKDVPAEDVKKNLKRSWLQIIKDYFAVLLW